jgi:hypothetical protein
MKHLKNFNEGFFDFFKKKVSEDDRIIDDLIRRLKRVKGISPYIITLDDQDTEDGEKYHTRYRVEFDDVHLLVKKAEADRKYRHGWSDDTQRRWFSSGAIKKSNNIFYSISVEVVGEEVFFKTSWRKVEDVFNLVDYIYKNDKEARRIEKIRVEINPAADKLDPDIYGE